MVYVQMNSSLFPLLVFTADKPSVDFVLPPGTWPLLVEIESQGGARSYVSLSAKTTLKDPDVLAMGSEERAAWLRTVKLRPSQRRSGILEK
jgi:hypothetical protein